MLIEKVKRLRKYTHSEVMIIPKKILEEYPEQREKLAHALAGHIINLTNLKDANNEILLYEEKQDLIRWIARGEKIVSRINPDIFRRA